MSPLAASINPPTIVDPGPMRPAYHTPRRSGIRAVRAICRMISIGLALVVVLASPSMTSAQGAAPSGVCSEDVRQALMALGGWAEAQCASRDSFVLGLALPAVQRCTTEVTDGLRRIGGWAEAQCQS
jgi:hypothetical protein